MNECLLMSASLFAFFLARVVVLLFESHLTKTLGRKVKSLLEG